MLPKWVWVWVGGLGLVGVIGSRVLGFGSRVLGFWFVLGSCLGCAWFVLG